MSGLLHRVEKLGSPGLALLIALGAASCHRAAETKPAAKSLAQPAVQQLSEVETPEEKSCRLFVQGFYDWYINGHLSDNDKGPAWFDVAKQRPYLLSDQLRRLLMEESAEEDKTHEIGAIDFDPFLAAQDWSDPYKVTEVTFHGNHCDAHVSGSASLRKVELARTESSWVFVNFDYSSYATDGKTKDFPDYDLMQLLVDEQNHETTAKKKSALN